MMLPLHHCASSRAEARRLVLAHGWNATTYQILNPGISHWFSSRGDAVVGYVARAGVRVVAGAPVAPEQRLGDVAREFEADARSQGARVCYFGAEARLERYFAGHRDHAFVLLGAQPSWHPAEWVERTTAHPSLRAQFTRARHKGVEVTEPDPVEAERDPDLARCLARWLKTRGLPPLHFLIEPETLTNLGDRRVFVARRNGATVGFAVASVIPARNGWLIEQFIRSPDGPNGTVELLLDTAARSLARGGAEYLSLGLAPLAVSRAGPEGSATPPLWLRLMLGWMRAHGRRFYNFRGLEAFKAKFEPMRWEPVYAISNEPEITPRTAYAIASAFTGGAPLRTAVRGLGWAALREMGLR
ncbi:MAG TPA: DUF2156 domain-containing protein [Gemmatimonadales bacterium]|nr:DUF2156 domain-containing protein [Gemmatimonadales bacterium]